MALLVDQTSTLFGSKLNIPFTAILRNFHSSRQHPQVDEFLYSHEMSAQQSQEKLDKGHAHCTGKKHYLDRFKQDILCVFVRQEQSHAL